MDPASWLPSMTATLAGLSPGHAAPCGGRAAHLSASSAQTRRREAGVTMRRGHSAR